MGKTTDKFIADIKSLSNNCKSALADVDKQNSELERLQGILHPICDKMSARGDEIRAQVQDGQDWVKVMYADPVWQKLSKGYDDYGALWDKAKAARNEARNEVNQAISKLDGKLNEFNTFVTKKSKSKNPFKSKKSLPLAQQMIEEGQGLSKVLKDLVKDLTSKNF